MLRQYDAEQKENLALRKNTNIFNGVKGLASLYLVYGSTYFISWYAYYDNPYDIQKMQQGFGYAIIAGTFFITPVLFLAAGFLITYSFMKVEAENRFSLGNIGTFYFRRIARLVPLNLFMILFAMFIIPTMGGGPIWYTVEKEITS